MLQKAIIIDLFYIHTVPTMTDITINEHKFDGEIKRMLGPIYGRKIILFPCCLLLLIYFTYSTPEEIRTLKASGNYQLAFMKMLQLQKKQPTAQLLFDMAELLETMQDYTMAMMYYQELISSYPGNDLEAKAKQRLRYYFDWYRDKDTYSFREEVVTYLDKGNDALNSKDFHKAILYFKQGLELKSNMYLLNFNMAYAYYELYKLYARNTEYQQNAIRYYIKAVRVTPSAKAFNNLACIFAEQGDEILSHLYFKKAIDAASAPVKLTGIIKLIRENMDYFTGNSQLDGLNLLRELLP